MMLKHHPYLLVFCIVSLVLAEKHIGGEITSKDLIATHGPFIVQKDIIIPAGTTVEIPAGCVFLFANFTGILVHGKILVKGTPDNPVVFTSKQDVDYNPNSQQLPVPFDWNGLYIAKESVGSIIDNFRLSYSVYGIKSQSEHLIIQNGMFVQNGQYHVTIREKIQVVQENIPYSFDAKSVNPAIGSLSQKPSKEKPRVKPNPKRTLLRWGGIAVGAVGIGAGVYYANQASDAAKVVDAGPQPGRTIDQYNDAVHRRDVSRGTAIGSFIGAALGAIGFGVSFAF